VATERLYCSRNTRSSWAAALAPPGGNQPGSDARPLTRDEALELLALGEVIARKAGYGRQLAVRTARATGASWSQIGAALAMSKQSAWETYTRWLDEQDAGHSPAEPLDA
jgi:hypothetical protein